MDHGTEFTLVVSVQRSIAALRNDPNRHPVLQSMLRQNYRKDKFSCELPSKTNSSANGR